jgi:Ca-activated chloride channel family protein
MSENPRRRHAIIALLLLLVIVLALLLTQCLPKRSASPAAGGGNTQTAPMESENAAAVPASPEPDEDLSPATLTVPEKMDAGAVFTVGWEGPDNKDDYVTVVAGDAAADKFGDYRNTREGATLTLTAPVEPGVYEVRYVAGRSRTVLGRASIEVTPTSATLEAPDEVVLGSKFTVGWTGPDNQNDYITIVQAGAPDDKYGSYTNTSAGASVTLTAPIETRDAEVRYVTGQGHKVLARRAIRVVAAEVSLDAPAEAIAGTTIEVTWTGPDNQGDYITVVPVETADGQYGNYTNVSARSPLKLLTPIIVGDAELRYMTGQGGKVLARRVIKIVAAEVALDAAEQCVAAGEVSVTWTGPNNPGDYITLVAKGTPDGQYAGYQNTTAGSPLIVKAPKEAGEAELRYMTGQGGKVLARRAILVVP